MLGVLGLHGGAHIDGGFIGVDIFFVLSGFLITSLLLQEWDRAHGIHLRAFYLRRARRLLPALGLMLLGVGALVAIFPWYYQGRVSFGAATLSVVFYAANWVDAFASTPNHLALGPLAHAWSLSIEEQFYLLWPGILLICLRRRIGPRGLLAGLLLLVVLTSIERGVLWQYNVAGDPYYRTDTHADGILLGCALAVARSWPKTSEALKRVFRSTALAVLACGVLLGLALALTLNSGFLFLGGYAFVSVSSAIVIGHAVSAQTSIVARFLALPVLRWIGERSYGVYLFHVPIILLLSKGRIGVPTPVAFAIQVAVTFAVTALSYRFLELRFLKKRRATEPQNSPPAVIPPIPARELAPGQATD